MLTRVLVGAVVAVLASAPGGAASRTPASSPALSFHVFASTGRNMDGIVWTGGGFLYVENTTNAIWSAPPAGMPLTRFAGMPALTEETRCVPSPGTHGFPSGAIFCHAPDNRIYEIGTDGSSVSVFATLPAPYPPPADGALAFDDVGRFGYRLVVATGRSGAPSPAGGAVFTIGPAGAVAEVGTYPGPGGADELVVAPAQFGSAAGEALLTVDAGASGGALVAVDPAGRAKTVATFPDGANPLAVIPAAIHSRGSPPPGLYVTDDLTQDVYTAPAAQLVRLAGDVVVGSEIEARFWAVEPQGRHFAVVPLPDNLNGRHSLEACTFVDGRPGLPRVPRLRTPR